MKLNLKNGNILVKEYKKTEEDGKTDAGIIIPKEHLEDDEVAQGTVIESGDSGYKKGDVLIFHKVLPTNAFLKLDKDDKPMEYFFVKEKDVVCVIEK